MISPSSYITAGGFVDYTAVITTKEQAEAFLNYPILQRLPEHNHTLFALEAKAKDVSLDSQIPQAVCEILACAKLLRKRTIRGALTNGLEWIFILLKINDEGAEYWRSRKLTLMTIQPPFIEQISKLMCDTVAGIIAHWTIHSYEDIGPDDWLTKSST